MSRSTPIDAAEQQKSAPDRRENQTSSSSPAARSGWRVQLKSKLRGMDFAAQNAALTPGGQGAGESTEAIAARGLSGASTPVDGKAARDIEQATGVDVSHARIHTGPEALEAADAMGAEGFTVGNDVALASGDAGVMYHELGHVAQQAGGGGGDDDEGVDGPKVAAYHQPKVGPSGDLEGEADAIADAAMSGGKAPVTRVGAANVALRERPGGERKVSEDAIRALTDYVEEIHSRKDSTIHNDRDGNETKVLSADDKAKANLPAKIAEAQALLEQTTDSAQRRQLGAAIWFFKAVLNDVQYDQEAWGHHVEDRNYEYEHEGGRQAYMDCKEGAHTSMIEGGMSDVMLAYDHQYRMPDLIWQVYRQPKKASAYRQDPLPGDFAITTGHVAMIADVDDGAGTFTYVHMGSSGSGSWKLKLADPKGQIMGKGLASGTWLGFWSPDDAQSVDSAGQRQVNPAKPPANIRMREDGESAGVFKSLPQTLVIGEVVDLLDEETDASGKTFSRVRRASGGVFWTAASNLTTQIDEAIIPESTNLVTISPGGGGGGAIGGGGRVGYEAPDVDTEVETSHGELETELSSGHGELLDPTSALDACDLEAKQGWDADVKEYRDLIKHRPDEIAATANAPIDDALAASSDEQTALRADQEQAAHDEYVGPLEDKKFALFKKRRIAKKEARLERLGLTSADGQAPDAVGLSDGSEAEAHPADRALIQQRVQQRLNAWYFGEGGDGELDPRSPEDARAAVALMTQDLTNRFLSGRVAQEFLSDVAEYWAHFQTTKISFKDRRALKRSDEEAFDAYKDDRKLTRKVKRKHSKLGKAAQTVAGWFGKEVDPGPSPDDVAGLVATGSRAPGAIEPHILDQQARTPGELAGGVAGAQTVAERVDQVESADALSSAVAPQFADLTGISGIPAEGAKAPTPDLEPGAGEQVAAANFDEAEPAAADVEPSQFLTVVYKRLVELVLGVHAKPDREAARLKDLRVGDRVPVTDQTTEEGGRTWAQAIVDSPRPEDGGAKLGWVDTTFTNANSDREQTGLESGDAAQEAQRTLLGDAPKGVTVIDYLRPVAPGTKSPCYSGVYEADTATPVAEIGGTDDASLLAVTRQTADNDPDLLEVLVGGQPLYTPRSDFRVADPEERMIHLDSLTIEEIQQVRAYAAQIADPAVQAAFYEALQAKPMFLEASRSTVQDVGRRGPLTALAMAFEVLGVPMPYAEAGSYADALEMVRLERGLPEALDASNAMALAAGFGLGGQVIEPAALRLTLRSGQAVLAISDSEVLRLAGVADGGGWLVDDAAKGERRAVGADAIDGAALVSLSIPVEVDLGEAERTSAELEAGEVEGAFKEHVFEGTDEAEQAWYLGKSEAVHGGEVTDALKAWVPEAETVYCMPAEAQMKAFYANLAVAGDSLDTFVAVQAFVDALEGYHAKPPGKRPAVPAPAAIATMRSNLSATVSDWVQRSCPSPSEDSFRAGNALFNEAVEDGLLGAADATALKGYVDELLPDLEFDALVDLQETTTKDVEDAGGKKKTTPTTTGGGSGKTPLDAGLVDPDSGVGKIMGAMGAKRDFDEIHMDEGESSDLTLGFGHWAAGGLVGFFEDMPAVMPAAWKALVASVHDYFQANASAWPDFVADTGLAGSAKATLGNVDAGLEALLIGKVTVGKKEKSKLLTWSRQEYEADHGVFEHGSTHWFAEALPAAMDTVLVRRYQVYKWTEQMIEGGRDKAGGMDMDESLAGATMGTYLSSSGINKIGWSKSEGNATTFMKDRYGAGATVPVTVTVDDQTVSLDGFSYTSKGTSHTFVTGSVPAEFQADGGGATPDEVSEDWRVFVLFQKYRSYYANRKRRSKREALKSAVNKASGDPAKDSGVQKAIDKLDSYKTYTRDRLKPVWDDFLSVAWGELPSTAGEVPTQAHSGTASPRGDVSAEASALKAAMLSGEDVEEVSSGGGGDAEDASAGWGGVGVGAAASLDGGAESDREEEHDTYDRSTWTFWDADTFAKSVESEHEASFAASIVGAGKSLLDAVHGNAKAEAKLDAYTEPALESLTSAVGRAATNKAGFTKILADSAKDPSWSRRSFRFMCLANDPAVKAHDAADAFQRALLVAGQIGVKYADVFTGGPIASDDDPVWSVAGVSISTGGGEVRDGGRPAKGAKDAKKGGKSVVGGIVPDGTATGLLTDEELAKARQYYLDDVSSYPATLVQEIQMLCGVSETGTLDAKTIQAIAQYQKDHGLEVDGCAGGGTLTAMFGGDVRLIADEPPIIVENEGHERVEGKDVVMTKKIADAWDLLEPHLPAGTRMSSGYRPWEHQAEIMMDLLAGKKDDLIANGRLTEKRYEEIVAKRQYRQMQTLLQDQTNNMKKYLVAMPGRSKHQNGRAFDICDGASLSKLNGIVKSLAAEDAEFGRMFSKTIVEDGNGCVHIEVN